MLSKRGMFWTGLEKVLAQGIGLAQGVILARLLVMVTGKTGLVFPVGTSVQAYTSSPRILLAREFLFENGSQLGGNLAKFIKKRVLKGE